MREKPVERRAVLYSNQPPTPEQTKRFQEFLESPYDEEIPWSGRRAGSFPRASGWRWDWTATIGASTDGSAS